jgi:type VI secretion system protein ImpE
MLGDPSDSPGRLFLFELLTLAGELQEALGELKRVESDSPEWPASRRMFRDTLHAESRRFPRIRRPEFPVDPPRHLRCRWNAALCHSRGQSELALNWLDRADAAVPEVTGFVDGREFHGLRDSDDRFAAQFELVLGRRTAWIAFEDVRSLRLEKAEHLLDLAFRFATLTLADGMRLSAIVPLLYPGSSREGDDLALGQLVDWTSADSGLVCGLGARVLTFGDEELALESCTMIEIRKA